ncbi:MAG TPA: ceramidase domain-containing protein [Leptospiraceae bacterium]|nr:ceramidase domain-containing protein [Leptospiraceae bacterium]HMW04733.1 ceramidase domain-containing protein [Leptospiraceae bacterium]HMX35570.1 ceramidase domain-containing protein [Leptospiraceae bacterium]HMY34410.1 ceramidase domain-containing protein [Leptospiraceae bacterium]HMZ65561.1 ceramidase domain-containing protein [Leptospiraceae bacterium]
MEIIQLPPECFWSSFAPPTIKYCEENICSIITQPSNTWSNLAYIFIGFYLIWKNKNDSISSLKLVGPMAIATGIASFLYHASFTFFFQFFDLSSMYLFSTMILSMNLKRAKIIKKEYQHGTQFIILAASMLLLYIFKPFGIPIFALQVLAGLILEFYIFRKMKEEITYSYYKLSLLFLVLAFVAWTVDFRRIICDPMNHILQGHAVWHILSSSCFLFLYKFYSQEKLEKT